MEEDTTHLNHFFYEIKRSEAFSEVLNVVQRSATEYREKKGIKKSRKEPAI